LGSFTNANAIGHNFVHDLDQHSAPATPAPASTTTKVHHSGHL